MPVPASAVGGADARKISGEPRYPTACQSSIKKITAALQREDFPAAEALLRAELKIHPANGELLSLPGMALDARKRLPEADTTYHLAMAAASR